jgi:hypothetical protein
VSTEPTEMHLAVSKKGLEAWYERTSAAHVCVSTGPGSIA